MKEPKKTIIWGLESPETAPGLKMLAEDGTLQIIAWFGERRRGTHVTHELFDLQGSTRGLLSMPQPSLTEVYRNLISSDPREFMEMTARSYQRCNLEFYEYQNILALTAKFFLNLLNHREVELVIFGNIPHEGPDSVLYRICRANGIRTLLFTQSLFPNRFFAMERVEDLGGIAPESPLGSPYKIDRKFEKKLFYMDVNLSRKERLKALLGRVGVSQHLVRAWGHILLMEANEASRELLLHQRWKSFRALSNTGTLPDPLPQNYIYFPLHLQPELTTSALGGVYCDQLLALELLVSKLPRGWKVVVKENPKQRLYRRDAFFYQRLASIPDTVYVKEADTYHLMQHAKLVATITGTAGWEAISGGKPALIFGQAWYRYLPGVFTYSSSVDLKEISEFRFKHAELECRLGTLLASCGFGVVDPGYAVLVKDFDPLENSQSLAAFIRRHICGLETAGVLPEKKQEFRSAAS